MVELGTCEVTSFGGEEFGKVGGLVKVKRNIRHARLRARRIYRRHCEERTPRGWCGVNLPTTTIWGFCLWLLGLPRSPGRFSPGIVLDIVKAFNTLNRAILRELMRKAGIPVEFTSAWIHGLDQMPRWIVPLLRWEQLSGRRNIRTRRVNIKGNHFGICTGCTGVPEGDPLSVVAMRSFSRLFDCVVSASPSPTLTTGRCSRAIATSWCPCILSWLLSWVLAGCLWPLGNVGLTWTSNKWRFGRLRSFSFLFTDGL